MSVDLAAAYECIEELEAKLDAARERIEALESLLRRVSRLAPCACTTGTLTTRLCSRCEAIALLTPNREDETP
jgi:hypothetical protein